MAECFLLTLRNGEHEEGLHTRQYSSAANKSHMCRVIGVFSLYRLMHRDMIDDRSTIKYFYLNEQ